MKHTALYIILIPLAFIKIYGQDTKPIKDIKAFEILMTEKASTIKSIESDFTQIKHLDIFNEKIISKGKFYYKEKNKIRMDYKEPMDYLIVINANKIKILSDGKENIMDLKSNEMLNKMQDMITACMIGSLSKIDSQYKVEYFETASTYLIKMIPTNESVKSYISEILIHIDKTDFSVHKLRLYEGGTDYTEYEFYNKKFNSLENEAIFNIN